MNVITKNPLSENEMLKLIERWTFRPNVKRGIIKGTRRSPSLNGYHTIITGDNTDKKLNQLMDDLYMVYRMDPDTENGMCIMPWIDTLQYHIGTEFHIYSTKEGVVKGFFAIFLHDWKDIPKRIPTLTFLWVVPKFRRKGLFREMYRNITSRFGPTLVDAPNGVCEACLDSMGYSRERIIDYYSR